MVNQLLVIVSNGRVYWCCKSTEADRSNTLRKLYTMYDDRDHAIILPSTMIDGVEISAIQQGNHLYSLQHTKTITLQSNINVSEHPQHRFSSTKGKRHITISQRTEDITIIF